MEERNDEELYLEIRKMMKTHFIQSREVLEQHGLYVGQPRFLFVLLKHKGISQKEMAEILGVKPATVNVTVKRLEKSGFIEKKLDETNKRISRLYLTEQGEKTCLAVKEIMKDLNEKSFDILSIEEKTSLKNILKKVNDNLEKCLSK